MKSLMDWNREYVEAFRNTQAVSEATIKGYGNKCRSFLRTLDASDGVEAFEHQAVRDYLERQKKVSERTHNNIIFALRHFARWLKAKGIIAVDPTLGIELAKIAASKRTYVPDEYFFAMLTACDRMPHLYKGKLLKAMISCAGYAGLRPAETLALVPADVDVEARKVVVWKGKGKKFREVYPCGQFWEVMEAYLEVRPKGEGAPAALFCLNRGRPVATYGYARLFEQVKIIAGLREKTYIKPHSLRHTCATRLHRNGMALIDLASFLGHSSVRTTELYLHTGHERLKSLAALGNLPEMARPPAEKLKEPPLPPPISKEMELRLRQQKRRRIGL